MDSVSVQFVKSAKVIVLTLILTIAMFGCAQKNTKPLNVNSNSEMFTNVAQSLQAACNNPAEFGRCGCRLNGLLTTCGVVNRCLENGFCEMAKE